MAPSFASSWMQQHRATFGKRPISKLCIPESHDAGTSVLRHSSKYGKESQVLTQTKSIYEQLNLGVRRLDIRPALTTGGGTFWDNPFGNSFEDLACGHWTGEAMPLGWQGGNCVKIRDLVTDLNRFTKDNAELVFVDINHYYRIHLEGIRNEKSDPSNADWGDLLGELSRIDNLFTTIRAGGRDIPLDDFHLDKYIGDAKAAVVVLVDSYHDNESLFDKGFWPYKMVNSERNYMSHHALWVTRTQGSLDAVASVAVDSQFEPFKNPFKNPFSVLELADREQANQFPWLLQKMASEGYNRHVGMDKIETPDLLTFCLAASFQQYHVDKGMFHDLVVTYGGKLIEDNAIRDKIHIAFDNAQPFQVSNESLGGDPWPGMVKSCAVFYWQNNVWKGRFARENDFLHFELDIISIQWGPSRGLQQSVYLKLLKAVGRQEGFAITNDNLGGDTAPGQPKGLVVSYRKTGESKDKTVVGREDEIIHF